MDISTILDASNVISAVVGAVVTVAVVGLTKLADKLVGKAADTETTLDNLAVVAVAEALHAKGLISAAALQKVKDKLEADVLLVISPVQTVEE